jgi:hypothetical protein
VSQLSKRSTDEKTSRSRRRDTWKDRSQLPALPDCTFSTSISSLVKSVEAHSHVAVTQACYIKTANEDARAAMQKLETALNDAAAVLISIRVQGTDQDGLG